ncbi:MAG: hypothetical protein H0A76_08260 [Candidatus Thiodubiliella endoseptemdiera]|uniref:Uncharacterized protein n=1 Tax=Candidatus Thiodubiliella endoseptemdiera TaxID=2738886 RepID=A0A853F2V9_9GAMM|nr:hypothetical protein [Candidatus Thiodubiliella endoseptemdiera]
MIKNYFNISIIILLLFSGNSSAVSVSKGTTYEIVEPDLLVEIKQKADQVNWKKLQKNMKLTQDITHLPIAKEDESYYHQPIVELPFEVKDKDGKILYPKGFKFNPLKYTTLPNQLIVLGSPRHLETVSNLSSVVSSDDTLLIANMDTVKFIKQTGKRAFLLTENAIKRLGIKKVPSVISQKGDRFLIQVFAPRSDL